VLHLDFKTMASTSQVAPYEHPLDTCQPPLAAAPCDSPTADFEPKARIDLQSVDLIPLLDFAGREQIAIQQMGLPELVRLLTVDVEGVHGSQRDRAAVYTHPRPSLAQSSSVPPAVVVEHEHVVTTTKVEVLPSMATAARSPPEAVGPRKRDDTSPTWADMMLFGSKCEVKWQTPWGDLDSKFAVVECEIRCRGNRTIACRPFLNRTEEPPLEMTLGGVTGPKTQKDSRVIPGGILAEYSPDHVQSTSDELGSRVLPCVDVVGVVVIIRGGGPQSVFRAHESVRQRLQLADGYTPLKKVIFYETVSR